MGEGEGWRVMCGRGRGMESDVWERERDGE